MLKVSDKTKQSLSRFTANKCVHLSQGNLFLYSDLEASNFLETHNVLNVLYEDVDGVMYAFEKSTIEQDGKYDASCVVYLKLKPNGDILMQHWRGYESLFDSSTLLFKGQAFTK